MTGAYPIMWQVQFILGWVALAQGLNMAFAALCVWAAFGLSPRWFALVSAGLYLGLAIWG